MAETCKACGGSGKLKLTQCPYDYVGGEIIDIVGLIQLADDGDWPEGGGTLDQADSFIQARNVYRAAVNQIEKERTAHG